MPVDTFTVTGTWTNADNSPAKGTVTFFANNDWEVNTGVIQDGAPVIVTLNDLGSLPHTDLVLNTGGYHVLVRIGPPGNSLEFDLPAPNAFDVVDLSSIDAETSHFNSQDIGAAAIKRGGNTNQVYGKLSDADYDADWIDVSGAGGDVISVAGRTGAVVLTSTDVGLALVDNTADASKPISAAQQAALDAKQPLDSDLTTISGAANTSFGLSVLTQADAAALRTLAGLGSAATSATSAFDAAGAASTAQAAAIAASQPVDSDLTAIAALATTSFGRSLLTQADAAALRTTAGLGTAATQASSAFDSSGAAAAAQAASQPVDSDLTAIAALTTTSFGRSFLALADAAGGRTLLGLGSVDNTADTAKVIAGDITGTLGASVLSGSSNVESIIRANSLDQLTPPAANLSMNSKRVTSVADATAATDALNRQFGDGRYLQLASNLSDLNSAKTARSSTGLNVEGMTAVADANKTAAATDRVIGYSSISATRTVTLPAASAVNGGAPLVICDLSGSCGSGTNIINIAPAGADTIDGLGALTLYSAYASVTLVSDGTSKWVYSSIVTIPWTVGQGGTGAATASAGFRNVFAFARHAVADANYTAVLTADTVIAYTSMSAARTVTLPTAVGNSWALIIKDESGSASGTNIIKLATTSSQTVDGNASPFSAITTARGVYRIYSNGANWFSW